MSNFTINLLPEDFREPPVYFYTASSNFIQSTVRYPEGAQQFHQILLVLAGTGILHCQGKHYPLMRGCAFFTAEGCISEYINTGGLTTAFLTARGSALPGLLSHYGCSSFLFAQHVNLEKYLSGINQILREYYAHKREGLLSSLVYAFYIDFFEDQTGAPTSAVEQASLFIEKNFMQKLTLDQLAALSGISVSKLCHDFKRRFGCTVFAYILNLRLTYARNLMLTNPNTRTKDAALSCGFEDISYFCKAYKKKFGKTPAQDRIAQAGYKRNVRSP